MPKLVYGRLYLLKQNLYSIPGHKSNVLISEDELKNYIAAEKNSIYKAYEDEGLYPTDTHIYKTTEIGFSKKDLREMYLDDDLFEIWEGE